MAAMLIDNHKQTIMELLREGETLFLQIGDQETTQKLQAARKEASEKKEPTIMFYGLYNAGKSTLINALCRKDIAPVGDVPTTTTIQAVPWEGYTLIDTPGINAHAEHTEIAEKEIRQSDVILFIMDNADTFDNAIVYQAIVDILKMGKPLAIVVNQKNVDENEDPNIPVPDQSPIRTIIGKVSSNLETQGARNGMQIVGKSSNFLGIFPVNALTAFEARNFPGRDGEMLYAASGVLSLRNALNETVRQSEFVYMLRTPLINLRDILREAMKSYQDVAIYGEKQQLAENRESLLDSRQRLRDRLMVDGLRKIEAVLEEMKNAAANGQAVEGLDKKLSDELNLLLKEAAAQEQEILQTEIKLGAMPDYHPAAGSEPAPADDTFSDDLMNIASVAAAILEIIEVPIPTPIPIPLPLIVEALRLIGKIFGSKTDRDAEDAARRSQEQLAQYYKWLNELRDQEIKIKADYEKVVNDLLQQYYDPKLAQIDQALTEVNDNCAEHTRNLRAMELLLLRTSDEMMALPEVI